MCLKLELQKGGAALKHWLSGLCEYGPLLGKGNLIGIYIIQPERNQISRQYFLRWFVEEEKLKITFPF